ncbi:hypothetical protein [Microcoleus sp. herbarium12]|uniref:hypothetical protein n=1 Tax=Microcoleus sp. herbarium12 TaxID=3055437 RepID=UPI002FD01A54
MKKTLTSQEKFRIAVEKIVSKEHTETIGKAQLTKIVKQWEKEEPSNTIKKTIEQVLLTVNLPKESNWVQQRYTYVAGYFWLENSSHKYGDTVLGWHDDPLQIQAEALPLKLHFQRFDDDRYLEVLDWGWDEKGFMAAEDVPLCWHSCHVEIPIEKTWFFCKYKYAAPCQLQWQRKYDHIPEERGLYVLRSIIPHGFWQAWKWWPEAREWYYEHRPELFEEEEIWGKKPTWNEPPNSYSAVLSPNNSNSLKNQIFHIEE